MFNSLICIKTKKTITLDCNNIANFFFFTVLIKEMQHWYKILISKTLKKSYLKLELELEWKSTVVYENVNQIV